MMGILSAENVTRKFVTELAPLADKYKKKTGSEVRVLIFVSESHFPFVVISGVNDNTVSNTRQVHTSVRPTPHRGNTHSFSYDANEVSAQ